MADKSKPDRRAEQKRDAEEPGRNHPRELEHEELGGQFAMTNRELVEAGVYANETAAQIAKDSAAPADMPGHTKAEDEPGTRGRSDEPLTN